MSKDTYYFSHDYNTRSNAKIKKLLLKHGMTGYGVFWSIIEDLYNNANALPTDYECIAYDLRVDESLVKSILNDFGLFVFSGQNFGSNSVANRLAEREEKSEKAKKSAQKRWSKPSDNANAMRTHSEGNAIKERKGKEIKGNDIKEKDSKEDERVISISGADAPPLSNNLNDLARGAGDLSSGQQKKEKEKGSAQKEKERTAAQVFTDAYCEFYQERVGVKPNFTAADGAAAAKLRKYLIDVSKDKTEASAISGLRYVFQNWEKLEPFIQNQLKLTQISSNINNILNQLKNGKPQSKSTNTGITDADLIKAVRHYSTAGH